MNRVLGLCFAALLLLASACASGTALVTGSTRPAISPDLVVLYLEPPAEFEVIGLVSASSDAGWTDQGSLNYAVAELRKQAARLGANGVLLGSTGETTSTMLLSANLAIPVKAKTVEGRAIFVRTPAGTP